jgi:hypothetical protein
MSNEIPQLAIELAAVCGFAAGNRTAVANAIKQANQALGIDKDTRKLTNDDKAAIVQWHSEQRKQTNDNQQDDIEVIAPPVPLRNDSTTIEQVKTIAPDTVINEPLNELELLRIENAKLQARLESIDSKAKPFYGDYETVRVSISIDSKRVTIAISGFYLNALMNATGIDKKGVSAWINTAINDFTINENLNVTEQVKFLIVKGIAKVN